VFKETIDAELLLLINKLSQIPEVYERFYMAGETALALHLGHRKSLDIDLFAHEDFNVERYSQVILGLNGKIVREEKGTVDAIIEGVKLTMLYYPYKILEDFQYIERIKVADIKDIACMKVVAISQRAQKKDYYDICEILKIMSLVELKKLVLNKYGENKINFYHILKSFFYFEDVEDSPDPVSLNHTRWNDVKEYLISNEKKLTETLLG
jgi:predicted nucleotidyltransferase component of viral defense system